MAETSTKLGRVSLVPRGEYDPKAQYQRLDIVRYGGSSYLVLRDLQGAMPEDGEDYMLISEKGGKGDKGNPGDAAGFGAVSATVDDTSGTPSVDVTSTGPDTAKEFSFSFHGLKGEQGTEGEKGDTGETGNGIASIERTSGTGAAGTTDTYTITMTDGSTATFQVYNGADGTGAGDMLKSVYDPQNKNTDIFSYVDKAVSGVEINVDADPTEGSPNPVSSGGTFSALANKQPKLTGQTGQVVGFAADGAAVAVPGWSNQNLLINSDFRNPVNRIGKTEYTGAGYTIDRFILQSVSGEASIKIGDRCVKLYAKDNDGLHQILEPGVLLCNTNYTCSILTKDGDLLTTSFISPAPGTTGGNTINYPGTIWMLFIWFSENDQTCHVWPVITYNQDSVKEIDIVAMKLEIGSQQTLAHQDADGNWVLNDPPNYDLQYALCSLYSPSTGEWVGNQHSNPNLLDNWYFADPINQREQTEYTSQRVQQYTIDRWISAGDTTPNWGLYLEDGGIRLSKGSAFQQKMDKAPPDGTVLTFSALIDWVVYSITFTWNSSTGYQCTNLPNGFALSWNGLNGYTQIFNPNGTGSEIVQAAKLELGPVQTLAHQDADGNWVLNDPPPNKALELAKCQYYYKPKNDNWISACVMGNGYVQIRIPGKMRIVPAVENTIPIFGTDEQWHNSVPLISKFLFPDSVVLNYFDYALIGSAFNRGDCVLLSYQPALNADL